MRRIWLGYFAIPLAILSHYVWPAHGSEKMEHWEPLLTFILSGIALIPPAHLMGEATAHLAEKTGPTIGGLLNATFGNAAELIIGIIALTKGLNDVVKASLTGSIVGNLLLVAGAAMVIGGWRRERQRFSRDSAQTNSALLAVSVAAMLVPAIFHFTYPRDTHLLEHEAGLSTGTAIVLLAVYVLGLFFTLKTHRHIFSATPAQSPEDPIGPYLHGDWSVKKSTIALLVASVLTAVVAELLVGSVARVAESLRWNQIFVGAILLAIFGNAAEHSTAVLLARRNDMETAMTITYQSSLQIALFATPFLVLLSEVLVGLRLPSCRRLDMVFSPMEVVAVILTVAVVIVIGLNGETNWFEGVMLLAVYAILGIAFFYIPSGTPGGYDNVPAEGFGHGASAVSPAPPLPPRGPTDVTAR
ncbi:MAG TPA: calcium/proton exchanger [Tepidisphaeraceae bacterium]|jgi:Ca2+:H+ antiporter|nr:calcium/proton exchanger [Tepidisphaeraceae bacterium]